ncbi:hypothetical protein WJX72_011653 [[Myrmecia] bisecta]|uniref:BACK domain-containing protein n=1 Tax=[Myrmecia] bisecta TaxID=41462 RepID=A0AAW1PTV3_9CHLO
MPDESPAATPIAPPKAVARAFGSFSNNSNPNISDRLLVVCYAKPEQAEQVDASQLLGEGCKPETESAQGHDDAGREPLLAEEAEPAPLQTIAEEADADLPSPKRVRFGLPQPGRLPRRPSAADGFTVAYELWVSGATLAGASEWFRDAAGFGVGVAEAELLQLLLLAGQYAVEGCVTACAQLLDSPDLSLETALHICVLANDQDHGDSLKSLSAAANARIMAKFGDFDAIFHDYELEGAFLDLPFAAIKMLVDQDNLQVEHENTVFSAVMAWMAHNDGTAAQLAACHLRYAWMTTSYLQGVVFKEQLFKDVPNHEARIRAALVFKSANPAVRRNIRGPGSSPRQHYTKVLHIDLKRGIKVSVATLTALLAGTTSPAHKHRLRLGGYLWLLTLQSIKDDTLYVQLQCVVFHALECQLKGSNGHAVHPGLPVVAAVELTVDKSGLSERYRIPLRLYGLDKRQFGGGHQFGFAKLPAQPAGGAGLQSYIDRCTAAGYIDGGHLTFHIQVIMPIAQ